MAKFRYARDEDIVSTLDTATVSVDVGTEDTDYPLAGLTDKNPAKPAKLDETTGTFMWDFGSAQRVDGVFVPHHNLDAGLAVSLQMNATDSWGTPTVDQSLTVPAYLENGFPVGFWYDLTTSTGYSASGFRYVRLHISGTNSAAIAIGECILTSVVRTFTHNIHWGVRFPERHPAVVHDTDWGVNMVFNRGTFIREIAGETITTDTGRDGLRDLHRDASQRAKAVVIVPDGDVNDCLYMRAISDQFEEQAIFTDNNRIRLAFREVSRGLVL